MVRLFVRFMVRFAVLASLLGSSSAFAERKVTFAQGFTYCNPAKGAIYAMFTIFNGSAEPVNFTIRAKIGYHQMANNDVDYHTDDFTTATNVAVGGVRYIAYRSKEDANTCGLYGSVTGDITITSGAAGFLNAHLVTTIWQNTLPTLYTPAYADQSKWQTFTLPIAGGLPF